ncbi:unnamed protein product [Arabidopsis arenosa]|uniref:FBD domain-containing protein n=1 Tax=Arabidopsis arenosa TaxID=38785 RepID=A0A8S2AYB9_ARAAE|nr:unnamed protein product [Arabidopsis arenosa]
MFSLNGGKKSLWALEISSAVCRMRNDGFSDFMEKTVALLSNCPIKRLTLNCHYEQSSVDHWIRSALERGCLELNLQSQYAHSLDIGIFSRNNTLVKLTLSSFRTFVQGNFPPDGTVFFPALKTLSLGAVVADPALYNWLISGCPVLEELLIRDVGDGDDDQPTWTRSVVSASIKRLTIYFHYPLDTYPYEDDVEIKTPNLEFLDYSALLSDGSDVDYLDSLAEARLDLRLWELPTTDRSPPSEVEGRCCLSTCRVKVLEISGYGGSYREVKQMEHFLGKLKYLETVKIGVEEDNNSEYLRANLMTLARASSKCNIQFI